jgi:hypothetical protein
MYTSDDVNRLDGVMGHYALLGIHIREFVSDLDHFAGWVLGADPALMTGEAHRPYFSSNSTNSMRVVPVFFTALVCPASCQMKSPSYGAMPRSADPGTISASTPLWT